MAGGGESTNEMELVTLTVLAEAEEPVGSIRLMETFHRTGIMVAEATVGRYLRQLDERGLTESPNAKKGRLITAAGRQRLAQLQILQRQDRHGARLQDAVKATDLRELIDLLYVRRAVEIEAARLAATRATDEEIAQLATFAEAHIDRVSEDHEITEPSMNFHRMIAEASHNRMVIAVTLLLLDPANDPLEKILETIALDTGMMIDHASDHLELAAALQARDPQAAETTMRHHMDKLIHAVEEYRPEEHQLIAPVGARG